MNDNPFNAGTEQSLQSGAAAPPTAYPPPPLHVQAPRNGLAIASLVLGIVGIVVGLPLFTGFLAVILGVIGLILGLVNRSRLRSRVSDASGMTLAGIITSAIAILIGLGGFLVIAGAGQLVQDEFSETCTQIVGPGEPTPPECR